VSHAGYWYRDDSLVLWDAIWKFVDAVLSLYYKDDMAVVADGELITMLGELRQYSIKSLVCFVLHSGVAKIWMCRGHLRGGVWRGVTVPPLQKLF